MFQTYEFIYDEIPSSMYGLFICDFDGTNNENVPFGNKADIIEKRVNNRIRPLHFGVDYNSEPLSFNLVFAASRELNRWEMQEISNWLTGHSDYKWLQIEQADMINLNYKCLITELTPLHVGWAPYAFEATVRCDCPYAYGSEFDKTYNVRYNNNLNIFNEGAAKVPCKPVLNITPTGTSVSIINNYEGGKFEFRIDKIPSTVNKIFVNNENGVIFSNDLSADLYDGFNDVFFKLYPGYNNLSIKGVANITFIGRYYYNAGA